MDTSDPETSSPKLDSHGEYRRHHCRLDFLFCTLQTFLASLLGSPDAGAARLITRNNVSRFYSLPNAYERRIARIPGVERVAAANYKSRESASNVLTIAVSGR